jgi:hypothetical protein
VFFFVDKNKVDSVRGKVAGMREIASERIFVFMDSVDLIIKLFGKH